MLETIQVNTSDRCMAVDITHIVERKLQDTGVQSGLCVLTVAHTTAGLIINEGADPAVMEDVKDSFEGLIPWRGGYKHMEGNSAAHIKAILTGSSVQVIVENGRLLLGAWQHIFMWEFDGPRTRKIRMKIIAG